MNPTPAPSAAEPVRLATFDRYRGLLFSIAYRMLGSIADAEDMLQEAFIRWQLADAEHVRSPKAFLVTIVSRLCISHLQSARVQREHAVGQWLPEPVITDTADDPMGVLRVDESLSMALLVLLERLTPIERAVFLLHEAFGYRYAEIAKTLGQTEANCRQIFHRARRHVGEMRRRFDASAQQQDELLERFIDAAREGDLGRLVAMLEADVALHIDGSAAGGAPLPNVVRGADKVVRGLAAGARSVPADAVIRTTRINGDPGIVTYVNGRAHSVLTLDVRDGRIRGIYIVTNPRKLAHLPPLAEAP
jgi:RNA polymerase sigma-70 factor (ECF subfamily)